MGGRGRKDGRGERGPQGDAAAEGRERKWVLEEVGDSSQLCWLVFFIAFRQS